MRYGDASALRAALEVRLKREADSTGHDLGRLRHAVVFERLAARLSADPVTHWIVKGGAARGGSRWGPSNSPTSLPVRSTRLTGSSTSPRSSTPLTRDYGDRPNTRGKDLVDLVLLIEDGLRADRSLVGVARLVFDRRALHPLPDTIPDLPRRRVSEYPELASGLVEKAADPQSALKLVRSFWAVALHDATRTEP